MRIPPDALIQREKITEYLLVPRPKNDKSQFLAQAGFTLDNPDELETALRRLVRSYEAVPDRSNEYGDYYRVEGELFGPQGRPLAVITIWIIQPELDNQFRFVTLKPRKVS